MPAQSFRGDPYRVLGVDPRSTDAAIKRRWRELAREHHPDRASDPAEAAGLTRRMARINAAYDLLRDPLRRLEFDGRGVRGPRPPFATGSAESAGPPFRAPGGDAPAGPPRPRPTRPVTERFDASDLYRRRNATTSLGRVPLDGHRPGSARERRAGQEPLRSSEPTGPIVRRRGGRRARVPSLDEARATILAFGKFRGHTLGQVELFEPTYIDWVARTITRDRDIVVLARVIKSDMDARGVVRTFGPSAASGVAGFGTPGSNAAGSGMPESGGRRAVGRRAARAGDTFSR